MSLVKIIVYSLQKKQSAIYLFTLSLYTCTMVKKFEVFKDGAKDAIPVGLGYFAVSFSLGIAARKLGMSPLQGFVISFLNNASAGEYVAFTLIAAQATILETIIATVITNARYLLMSTALSQKIPEGTPFWHRLLIAFDVTDELFALGIVKLQTLGPHYMYGAYSVALPGWAVGTTIGVLAGTYFPSRIVSILSVALFGMFIAIVIPPARKNKVILGVVFTSYLLSGLWAYLPFASNITEGTKTILLTIGIASIASLLFPHKEDDYEK